MSLINPIITTQEEQFVVKDSDFAFFHNHACRCESGVILLCRSGEAEIVINQYRGAVKRDTIILILPGSMLMLTNRSDDFRMSFFAFSRDLFEEAGRRLNPAFFQVLREHPIFYPNKRIVDGTATWFDVVTYTYRDRQNMFRNTIIKNRLQNVLLEMYDKQQRFATQQNFKTDNSTRQIELFHKFVSLVNEHCTHHREVTFYAEKLCISPRYLSTIVRNMVHSSAKEFIDRSVVLEIKIMLTSTDLSIQEIAFRLHFPDQSYLGRYFKKQTGESPTEYRNTKK